MATTQEGNCSTAYRGSHVRQTICCSSTFRRGHTGESDRTLEGSDDPDMHGRTGRDEYHVRDFQVLSSQLHCFAPGRCGSSEMSPSQGLRRLRIKVGFLRARRLVLGTGSGTKLPHIYRQSSHRCELFRLSLRSVRQWVGRQCQLVGLKKLSPEVRAWDART